MSSYFFPATPCVSLPRTPECFPFPGFFLLACRPFTIFPLASTIPSWIRCQWRNSQALTAVTESYRNHLTQSSNIWINSGTFIFSFPWRVFNWHRWRRSFFQSFFRSFFIFDLDPDSRYSRPSEISPAVRGSFFGCLPVVVAVICHKTCGDGSKRVAASRASIPSSRASSSSSNQPHRIRWNVLIRSQSPETK